MGGSPADLEARRARVVSARMREVLVLDVILLVLCLVVVIASVVLTPGDEALRLFGVEIPSTCMFRNITGMRCPGCGMTRSFAYMGHLDVVAAFRMHWLGPLLYLVVAVQVPWRAWALATRRWKRAGDELLARAARHA